MPHLGHDLPQRFKLITNAVSMFLLIVVFFILQYIFDMDFVCSCMPGMHPNGYVYLMIPPGILTLIVNITEPFYQMRIFSTWHGISRNNVFDYTLKLFINYLCLGVAWITSVLFDGDWYICLKTNLNSNQTGIPCKENLTYEEYKIKAGYKTESLDYGLCLIFCFLIVWSIAEIIRAYCNRKTTWKRGTGSTTDMLLPPYYRKVYEGLLAEQVSGHLKEELTKIATARAEAICQPHLRTIGDHERPFNNTCDSNDSINVTVLEAWKKISASDFPLT